MGLLSVRFVCQSVRSVHIGSLLPSLRGTWLSSHYPLTKIRKHKNSGFYSILRLSLTKVWNSALTKVCVCVLVIERKEKKKGREKK